ncbi:hypothetical protein [Flavobacterium sp.]|uniref:hypothetical protein n=1 Tax=Flavobacterium sp. TaxID=239 RepID=UPI0024873273|nr:hypothetical protein [Flavobacterium sp.]MDI1317624.1 hypothetical protein [Flavobacterium sp.]
MKKIASLFVLLFILNSCSPSDGVNYSFELVKIDSVEIPAEFALGETYPITVHYKLPSSCHYFNNLYYDRNLNVRTIAIESAVENRNNCIETPNAIGEHTFNFLVTSNGGSYIFKFYQGKNESGENQFLEYEVPVTN